MEQALAWLSRWGVSLASLGGGLLTLLVFRRSAKRRVDRRLPAAPVAALRRLHRDAAGPRGLGAEVPAAHRLGGGLHDPDPLPRPAPLRDAGVLRHRHTHLAERRVPRAARGAGAPDDHRPLVTGHRPAAPVPQLPLVRSVALRAATRRRA